MGKCFSSIVVKLCISSNALARLALGATYNRNPSNGQYSCPSAAGESDICTFTCTGEAGVGQTFHCENAGDCRFSCTEFRCADSATIYGDNANTLTLSVTSGGDLCFKRASVTAPTSGSLILDTMDDEKGYNEMAINSGSETQDIIIDCTYGEGDECKFMQINARTAQYLEVRINSATSELGGDESKENPVNIYCPQNSNYNGPEEASCIIDLFGGGTLHYANIYTDYGIPHDVWINGSGTITSTTLYCNSGSQTSNFLSTSGTCWNTRNPTADPTISPTTNDPTLSPAPSKTPTKHPSLIPTSTPSNQPTESHIIKEPTLSPTALTLTSTISTKPQQTLSVNTDAPPTMTTHPSKLTTKHQSLIIPSSTSFSNIDDYQNGDVKQQNGDIVQLSVQWLIVIGCGVVVFFLCCLIFCITLVRKFEKRANNDREHHDSIHRNASKGSELLVKWLKRKVELPEYIDNFMNNEYHNLNTVLQIKDKDQLNKIGINIMGHQTLLLSEIEKLREFIGYNQQRMSQNKGNKQNKLQHSVSNVLSMIEIPSVPKQKRNNVKVFVVEDSESEPEAVEYKAGEPKAGEPDGTYKSYIQGLEDFIEGKADIFGNVVDAALDNNNKYIKEVNKDNDETRDNQYGKVMDEEQKSDHEGKESDNSLDMYVKEDSVEKGKKDENDVVTTHKDNAEVQVKVKWYDEYVTSENVVDNDANQ